MMGKGKENVIRRVGGQERISKMEGNVSEGDEREGEKGYYSILQMI